MVNVILGGKFGDSCPQRSPIRGWPEFRTHVRLQRINVVFHSNVTSTLWGLLGYKFIQLAELRDD